MPSRYDAPILSLISRTLHTIEAEAVQPSRLDRWVMHSDRWIRSLETALLPAPGNNRGSQNSIAAKDELGLEFDPLLIILIFSFFFFLLSPVLWTRISNSSGKRFTLILSCPYLRDEMGPTGWT